MKQSHDSLLAALSALNRDQIKQAGQRYTPGFDPQAPNIQIQPLLTALENVACGLAAQRRFESVLDEFLQAWRLAKYHSQRSENLEKHIATARAFLAPMMNRLRACEIHAHVEWNDLLTSIESDLWADMKYWNNEEAKLETDDRKTGFSQARNEIRYKLSTLGSCIGVIQDEKEYVKSPAFKVLFHPNLLLCGEWGTGKTHLVCDFTQNRIDHDHHTILVLAKNFNDDVVEQICARIRGGKTITEVLDQLQELSYEKSERTVIILDGVNEGSRAEWRKAVNSFRTLVADRPNIGLIVTCRTP